MAVGTEGDSGSGTGAEVVARGCAESCVTLEVLPGGDGGNKLRERGLFLFGTSSLIGSATPGRYNIIFMVFFGKQQESDRLGLRAWVYCRSATGPNDAIPGARFSSKRYIPSRLACFGPAAVAVSKVRWPRGVKHTITGEGAFKDYSRTIR